MIVQACNTFDRFGAFRAAAGVAVRAAFSIIDANGVAADLTGRSIIWRFLDSRNAVVLVGTDPLGLIAATIAGAVASFDMGGAATEALRNKGVAGFEIAMLVGTGRVVLHRGAAAIDDAAPFAIGTDGAAGTNNLTVMAGSSTLIVSAQGAPGSSSEAIAAAALANAAAADSIAKTAATVTATGAAIAATADCTAKAAAAATATGKADAATAAAKAATDDGVAKTALTVTATNAATAGATAANNAAAQIVPEGGPSLLIKPGTGTFPTIADAYFASKKSLYSSFDGLRRQLRGFADVMDFTRATTGTYVDESGATQSAGIGTARLGFRFDTASSSWVLAGLLVEKQATNVLPNSGNTGAVAGTPGTMPNNWLMTSTANGLTRQIIGTGLANGIPYTDVRFFGTATANGYTLIGGWQIAVAAGQTWTASAYGAVIAGNASALSEVIYEFDGTNYAYQSRQANFTAQFVRRAYSRALTMSAPTRFQYYYQFPITTGVDYDMTVRLGGIQLELSSSASSYIPTTNAQATRAADFFAKAVGPEFNPASQTMLLRARWESDSYASRIGGWDGGTDSDRVILDLSGGRIAAVVRVAGVGGQVNGPLILPGVDYKIAFGFSAGILRLVVNGTSYGDYAMAKIPPLTTRRLGNNGATGSQPNFFIMPYLPHPTNPLLDATEFPRLLTVAEMQAYTA